MARSFIQGFVERGGNTVVTDGRSSTTLVQRSFPGATVDVFIAGTSNPASIFSDEGGTPKSNPFIADTDGYWGFWADDGRYDVKFSNAGILTPFSLFNLQIGTANVLPDPGSNGIVVRTALNTTVARTITGTTSAIIVTNGDGVSGDPIINLDANLNFVGKTITGGTYVSPGISSFANAIHTHEDAVGGGQLNATNIFNAGTVPVARLPILVGATALVAGIAGLAPAPAAGDENKFLRGDATWQTTGGGGGIPGSPSGSVQFNNAGSFGGISGVSGDATNMTAGSGNLRATSPRITTSINDINGNEVIGLVSVGSAVNEVSIANASAGVGPTLSTTGNDTNIDLNISAKGTGILSTGSNARISNNAPQVTMTDVNDSKTMRILLSGTSFSVINDTLGSTPLAINTTNNAVILVGELNIISSTIPVIRMNDTGDVASIRLDIESGPTRWRLVNENLGTVPISVDLATDVATFNQIPVGPTANPTTANQLTRKQYVDDQRVRWSTSWFYPILPSAVETTESVGRLIIPDGQDMFIEDITVVWAAGTDSGASNVFTIKKRNSAGTVGTDVGTIDVNTPAQNALQVNNVTNYALTFGDQIYPLFTTRNTASETLVTISVRGFQENKST